VVASPSDDAVAVSPADCRLNAFATVDAATSLWIKGKGFSLEVRDARARVCV
jgi:phosphatidylserine decarboxylase